MSEEADLEFIEDRSGDTGTASAAKEKLRRVAKYQRAVLFAVLVNFILNIVSLDIRPAPTSTFVLLGLGLIVGVISAVSIALLANELYGTGRAVLCAVLV